MGCLPFGGAWLERGSRRGPCRRSDDAERFFTALDPLDTAPDALGTPVVEGASCALIVVAGTLGGAMPRGGLGDLRQRQSGGVRTEGAEALEREGALEVLALERCRAVGVLGELCE